jgi:hypothetical protein
MKKVLLSAFAVLAFGFANAQEEKGNGGFAKGDLFVSGAVTLGSTKAGDDKTSGFEIEPKIGYFISENIAIGGKLGYVSTKAEDATGDTEDQSGFTVGGFGRYYFAPASQFSLFAELGVNYSSLEDKLADAKVNGFNVAFAPGLSYFLNDSFAIEASVAALSFTSEKGDWTGAENETSFGLGGDWRNVSFGVIYKF